MNTYEIHVELNPDREDEHNHGIIERYIVDRDHPDYFGLIEYLDRLTTAHIIDDHWAGALDPQGPGDVLEALRLRWNDELENVEGGYETPYSDGGGGGDSDPAYRRDMIDAGRGHLLR